MNDRDRVDGQQLPKPSEPGSDKLLSEETRERIAEAMEYVEQLKGARGERDDLDTGSR